MSSTLDGSSKRKVPQVSRSIRLIFRRQNLCIWIWFFNLAREYGCELYGRSISRVAYTEKHDKMKAWHLNIDMDYKGMLEQIIRNCGILFKERKWSYPLLIVNDPYYLSIGATSEESNSNTASTISSNTVLILLSYSWKNLDRKLYVAPFPTFFVTLSVLIFTIMIPVGGVSLRLEVWVIIFLVLLLTGYATLGNTITLFGPPSEMLWYLSTPICHIPMKLVIIMVVGFRTPYFKIWPPAILNILS